jgi:hypothetical protein
MLRTFAATSFAFVLAFSPLAMADQPYSQTTDLSCQMTTPLMPVGQPGAGVLWSRDNVLGGDSSTGPTFPISCLLPT